MKKQLLTIITLATIASASLAIAGGNRGDGENRGGGENRLQRMQQHLSLSDSQVEQIRGIREQGGGRDEVRAILTDEQLQIAEQHHRERGGDRRGAPPEEQDEQK